MDYTDEHQLPEFQGKAIVRTGRNPSDTHVRLRGLGLNPGSSIYCVSLHKFLNLSDPVFPVKGR